MRLTLLIWLISPLIGTIITLAGLKSYNGFRPSADSIYICVRGTAQKQGLIARQFNISDTNMTHIGIGFTDRDVFKVYHVSDYPVSGSCYRGETLDAFLSETGTRYFSAWVLKGNEDMTSEIKKICIEMMKKPVVFDSKFSSKNGDTLYCSEFCRNVLVETGLPCLFQDRKALLPSSFYKNYFGADTLSYTPVDFFTQCPLFSKVYEIRGGGSDIRKG